MKLLKTLLAFAVLSATTAHALPMQWGDGSDGNKTISSTYRQGSEGSGVGHCYYVYNSTFGGGQSVTVSLNHTYGLSVGDEVLIHQSQAPVISGSCRAGEYEFAHVVGISGLSVTLDQVTGNFLSGKPSWKAPNATVTQLVRVPNYRNLTINSSGKFLPWGAWTEYQNQQGRGGIIVFRVQETLTLNGRITANNRGYRWGSMVQGESFAGLGVSSDAPNFGGGGAGQTPGSTPFGGNGSGGGGGRHPHAQDSATSGIAHGSGTGGSAGTASLSPSGLLLFGSGGGGGSDDKDVDGLGLGSAGYGGRGGGGVLIFASNVVGSGSIESRGRQGTNGSGGLEDNGGGGGGSGGSIIFNYANGDLSNLQFKIDGREGGLASGDEPGQQQSGGHGSSGRFYVNQI